jgi:hypothetical protein
MRKRSRWFWHDLSSKKRKQETGLVEVKKNIGKTMDEKPIRKSYYGPIKNRLLKRPTTIS